jgi:putative ABC transport system permease protein
VFVAGLAQTSTAAWAERRGARAGTGTVLVPDGTPGLSDAAASAGALPTSVYVGGTAVPAAGVDRAVAPGSVLVSKSASGRWTGTVAVTWADGTATTLRIAGVAPESTVPAILVLSRAEVRAHDPSALSPAAPHPGPVPPVPGAKLVGVQTWAATADAAEDRLVWLATLFLIAVSAGFGALAVVNTLLMATTRRSRDFRLLHLAGATPGQVTRAVAAESAIVVVIGSVLGFGAALLALLGSARSLGGQIGADIGIVVPWPAVAAVVTVCLVLAVAASALPARALLVRRRPGPNRRWRAPARTAAR